MASRNNVCIEKLSPAGELRTIWAKTDPDRGGRGKYDSPPSTLLVASSQFSTNAPWRDATAGPSTRTSVSVIALVRPPEPHGGEQAQPTQRPKRGHLAACPRHRLPILRRHLDGPEAVQQDVRADSRPAAIGERLRDLAADGAILGEILGVRYRLACRANRRQLRGTDLVAVQEHVHGVAAADRRHGIGLDGRNERRVCGRQLWQSDVGRHSGL